MSKMGSTRDELSGLYEQGVYLRQEQQSSYGFNHNIAQSVSTIILKNMRFHPQLLTLPLHSPLTIKVSHNNTYQLSQISTKKKFIFSIQQLQIESNPIEQGQEYVFDGGEFNKKGEYRLKCISIPKMVCRIFVVETRKQDRLGQEGEVLLQEGVDTKSLEEIIGCRGGNNNNNNVTTSQGKLSSVQQQQTEQQLHKQLIVNSNSTSKLCSPSNFEQYQRMLNEQLEYDSNSPTLSNRSESLQSKYLNYFKEEFRLWRTFFQQQEVKKQQARKQQNKQPSLKEEQIYQENVVQKQHLTKQPITEQTQLQIQEALLNTPSLITLESSSQNIKSTHNNQHIASSQSQNQHHSNNQAVILPSSKVNLKKNKKNAKYNSANTSNANNNNNNNNNNQKNTNKNNSKKKPSLKPTLHQHKTSTATPQKNLSLSQVKEIDLSNNNVKSQYDYNLSSNSSSLSHESTTPNSKLIASHVHSHLHSHQEIVDRSHHGHSYFEEGEVNSSSCRGNRKQTKKTNSQYGFNVLRLQEKQDTEKDIDRIFVYGKQQQGVNIIGVGNTRDRLSDVEKKGANSSNNNTTLNRNDQSNKNNPNSSSRKSMSRTQTYSPVMRQNKKDNNFLTWAIQWAKQKDYKTVNIQRVNDHYLINQFNAYMKNRFKVTQFMYC